MGWKRLKTKTWPLREIIHYFNNIHNRKIEMYSLNSNSTKTNNDYDNNLNCGNKALV